MALQEKFREHGVVPDVIDEPPTQLATVSRQSVLHTVCVNPPLPQVKYDCGVSVEPGAVLTPTQVWGNCVSLFHYSCYTYLRSRMLQ